MNSTSELIEGVRAGDPEALCRWVARLAGPGQRLAAALLGDADEAQEAVQDALIAALSRLEDLRSPEALDAWFRQIVRTAVNRRRRARRETTAGESAPEGESREPMPDAAIENRELREQIVGAMRRLPATMREASELFYLEGRSISEIAEILHVPIGTVKRRLHSGRSQMRELLGGADYWSS